MLQGGSWAPTAQVEEVAEASAQFWVRIWMNGGTENGETFPVPYSLSLGIHFTFPFLPCLFYLWNTCRCEGGTLGLVPIPAVLLAPRGLSAPNLSYFCPNPDTHGRSGCSPCHPRHHAHNTHVRQWSVKSPGPPRPAQPGRDPHWEHAPHISVAPG